MILLILSNVVWRSQIQDGGWKCGWRRNSGFHYQRNFKGYTMFSGMQFEWRAIWPTLQIQDGNWGYIKKIAPFQELRPGAISLQRLPGTSVKKPLRTW